MPEYKIENGIVKYRCHCFKIDDIKSLKISDDISKNKKKLIVTLKNNLSILLNFNNYVEISQFLCSIKEHIRAMIQKI